jgi:hypothetical protein
MPESVEFLVDGQERSLLLRTSPDWPRYWGTASLVIGLHDAGQTAEQFYEEAEIDALIAGELNLLNPGFAEPIIAIFPRGLTIRGIGAPTWSCGPLGGDSGRLMDLDDVKMIAEGVSRVDDQLRARSIALGVVPPAGPFFGKKLILGRGAGGQLALRCHIELGNHPVPAGWPLGTTIVPDTIALVGTTAGGLAYSDLAGVPNPSPSLVGAAAPVLWARPFGTPPNIIQFHSVHDEVIDSRGGVSRVEQQRVDDLMGGAFLGGGFYRWDVPPGPDATQLTAAGFPVSVPLVAGTGIESWLPAGAPPTLTFPVAPVPLGVDPYVGWQWTHGGAYSGYTVRYLLTEVNRQNVGGHVWPRQLQEGWSATAEAFAFFVTYPP